MLEISKIIMLTQLKQKGDFFELKLNLIENYVVYGNWNWTEIKVSLSEMNFENIYLLQ